MRPKKILISCAGLGMGNASRVSAIAQELLEADVQLTIASWGAGFRFLCEFKKKANLQFDLLELKPYGGSLIRSAVAYSRNCVQLRRLISSFQPDAILLDSDYHVAAYIGNPAPRYFLGQADEIIALSGQVRLPTLRMRVDFLMRETLDRLFQKTTCSKVFCPSFDSGGSSGKFERIPLVVRREFLQPKESASKSERIGILSGGSGWDADKLSSLKERYPNMTEWVHPDGKILTRPSDLAPYEVIVCQGGMSSISECLALNKFMLIMPIQNQAEQFITAVTLEKKGLALMVDSQRPVDLLQALARPKPLLASVNCHGAALVAKRLLDAGTNA